MKNPHNLLNNLLILLLSIFPSPYLCYKQLIQSYVPPEAKFWLNINQFADYSYPTSKFYSIDYNNDSGEKISLRTGWPKLNFSNWCEFPEQSPQNQNQTPSSTNRHVNFLGKSPPQSSTKPELITIQCGIESIFFFKLEENKQDSPTKLIK